MENPGELLRCCGFRDRQEMFLVFYLREVQPGPVNATELSARLGIDPLTLDGLLAYLCHAGHLIQHEHGARRIYGYRPGTSLAARVDQLAELRADPVRRQDLEAAWQRHWVQATANSASAPLRL